MDNVDHGPIMIAFCDKIDALHYKTYGVFFRGGHCYARNTLKQEESTDASTATNSHTRQAAATVNQDAYIAPAPSMFRQNTPSTNARNAEEQEMPRQ